VSVIEAGGMEAVTGATVSLETEDGVTGRWRVGAAAAVDAGGAGSDVGRSAGMLAASFARSLSSCRVLSRLPMVLPLAGEGVLHGKQAGEGQCASPSISVVDSRGM
jgi:hypothetical protein